MAFWKFWRAVNNFESTSPEAAEGGGRRPLLTSLGLAIIDEIQFGSGEIVKNMLGGSATYCESQCPPHSFSTALVLKVLVNLCGADVWCKRSKGPVVLLFLRLIGDSAV